MLTHADTPRLKRRRPLMDVGMASVLAAAATMAVLTANASPTIDARTALSGEVIEARVLPAPGPIAQAY